MFEDHWFPDPDDNSEIEDFYNELQEDLIHTARDESDGKPSKSGLWEIIIREGLYQNLTKYPHVAIGFLLVTNHGPTGDYKEYLELADDTSDVIILIALSALVHDISHRRKDYLYDVIFTQTDNALGNIADVDYSEKLDYVDRFQSNIEQDLPRLDTLIAKAARSKDNTGLFDRPLINLLNSEEKINFLFKSKKHGFSVSNETEIDPSKNGCAYHLITNERILSVVGRVNNSDMLLSIPLSTIEKSEIHQGWTKDRIEITTTSCVENGPFNIWIPNIEKNHAKSDVQTHLESGNRLR